jgi:hypothetical protein
MTSMMYLSYDVITDGAFLTVSIPVGVLGVGRISVAFGIGVSWLSALSLEGGETRSNNEKKLNAIIWSMCLNCPIAVQVKRSSELSINFVRALNGLC